MPQRFIRQGLIVGAGHGLGLALVKDCLNRFQSAHFIATYRDPAKADELFDLARLNKSRLIVIEVDPLGLRGFDPLEDTLKAHSIKKLDLVINGVGALQSSASLPEKSIRDFDLQASLQNFAVNTCITPLLAQCLRPFFSRSEPSIFASLSAMVGSIEENKIGGWYSYRSSKAALNMMIKTLSIEFSNSQFQTQFVAIHPGTTRTELSKNFLKAVKHEVWEPEQSAQHIVDQLVKLPLDQTGVFINWDGRTIHW